MFFFFNQNFLVHIFLFLHVGLVGWWEGVMYLTSLGHQTFLTSLGHPTDIGLQLGKACYPCSR